MARIVPVLDLKDGMVVHAIAGQRERYQPIKSALTESHEPAVIAQAMLNATHSDLLYIADLNLIRKNRGQESPNAKAIAEICQLNAKIALDYGHRHAGDELPFSHRSIKTLILGTETIVDFDTVRQLLQNTKNTEQQIMLSIDLHAGELRSRYNRHDRVVQWESVLHEIDNIVDEYELRQLLVLDTAAVGRSAGPVTLDLCKRIRTRFPNIELWSGGGVRNQKDIDSLANCGVDAVLIATAIHAISFGLQQVANQQSNQDS